MDKRSSHFHCQTGTGTGISIIAIIKMMRMEIDFLHTVQVCGLSQQTREESVDLFEQSFSDIVWDPVQVFVSVKGGF